MTQKPRVCHVTSAHPRKDGRIFRKMCSSLAAAGYDVTLVVNDGLPEETENGVRIVSAERENAGRVQRIVKGARSVLRAALDVDADIYHLHDPELLQIVAPLKKAGKRVVFDSHEDVPADILGKAWIPAPLRRVVASTYALVEKRTLPKTDAVITVTPHIVERLSRIHPRTVMITNYPHLGEQPEPPRGQRALCHTGAIDFNWLLGNAAQAIEDLDGVTMVLAGSQSPDTYVDSVAAELSDPTRVDYRGLVTPAEVKQIHAGSIAGLALNNAHQLWQGGGTLGNNKLFEYMNSGLPLICTNFPLWEQIVREEECGFAVDPHDVEGMRAAVQALLDDPELGPRMGANGQRAVRERYNWATQEKILLDLYAELA